MKLNFFMLFILTRLALAGPEWTLETISPSGEKKEFVIIEDKKSFDFKESGWSCLISDAVVSGKKENDTLAKSLYCEPLKGDANISIVAPCIKVDGNQVSYFSVFQSILLGKGPKKSTMLKLTCK